MTADGTDKDRALSDIRSDIESTRERLAQTLDEIEDRLDVRKRGKAAWNDAYARGRTMVVDGRDRFDAMRQENPGLVYGALGGAAAVVVGAGVLIIRGARR